MLKNKILLFFLLCFYTITFAQSDTLTRAEYIDLVKKYHPVIKQTQLQNKIAENEVKAAKGNFDPIIGGKLGEKVLGGESYYQQKSVEIAIPTWYGVNVIGQINDLQGNRLNNTDTKGTIPQIGIEVPLGKGLFFDERRAQLQQAKIFAQMTENEQFLIVNDLLLNAHQAYIDWQKNFRLLQINQNAVNLNRERLKWIEKTVQLGERPAIDIIETKTQLQYYELKVNEANLNLQNSQLLLSLYLWNENLLNVAVPENVLPEYQLQSYNLQDNPEFATINPEHPQIQYYSIKNDFLEIERRLKLQSLLPKIDFNYNFLRYKDWQLTPLFQNNFQYGLKVEVPIFMRSARANYENAKLKILQNQNLLQQKTQELNVKLNQYKTQYQFSNTQIKLIEENLNDLKNLLRGEEIKFQNGESSMFLINSRENKLFEAQEKSVQLQAKRLENLYKILWITAGL